MPQSMAMARRMRPMVPMSCSMAAPVGQLLFSAMKSSHGSTMAVAVFAIMYMSAATEMELMRRALVFLLEKEYSSEACGMQSKPTKAHGASAAMVKTLDSADFSGAKNGLRLDQSGPPMSTAAAMTSMEPTRPTATAVWNQPAASTPRMLTTPMMTMAAMQTMSSPR